MDNYVRVEQVQEQVIALRPIYRDAGNVTELWLRSGDVCWDKRAINGVIKALSRYHAIDMKEQRRMLREKLNKRAVLPFYLPRPVCCAVPDRLLCLMPVFRP